MSKFKVGDRVVVSNTISHVDQFGDLNVLPQMKAAAGRILTISFKKKYSYGPGSRYRVEEIPDCYWSDECFSGLANNPKILITTSGPATIARLYEGKEVVRSAKAVCAPSDTFDFAIGAKLAFERLMEEEKPKEEPKPEPTPEPIKLYCVKDNPGWLTKGKVYEFDGHQVNYDEDGCFYAKDFEDWKRGYQNLSKCLVPLVKRPAKVGEYIVVMDMANSAYKDGRFELHDMLKVVRDDSNIIDQWVGRGVGFKNFSNPRANFNHAVILNEHYLVLDGYQPDRCKCCGQVIPE